MRGLNIVVVDTDRSDVSAGSSSDRSGAGIARVRTRRRIDERHPCNPLRAGDRCGLHPGDVRSRTCWPACRPQILAFYNAQYFTPGNIASKGLRDAISDAVSTLSPLHDVRLQPVGSGRLVVEQYVLTNPALNYAAFCCAR